MQEVQGAIQPAMTPAEVALLRAAAAGRTSVVEFGCGGSTPLLLEQAGSLASVDSDPAWLGRLRTEPACAAAAAQGRWLPIHVDVGPVGPWGWPLDLAAADGAAYAQAPWSAVPAPDLVLVDGRYRVACALLGLARVAPGGFVAVHDFWARPAYRILLDCASLEGSAGSLVLLQPRAGAALPDATPFFRQPQ